LYSTFQLATKYLGYLLRASNGKGHGIHSPFVFEFVTKVLNDTTEYPAYKKVEALREELLKNESIITIEDMGAGSSISKSNQRTIGSIARYAAKPKKYAQLLHRIAKFYSSRTIVELGTSLGITTCYLALADPNAKVLTLEGAPTIANAAWENFKKLQLHNIELVEGNFDERLNSAIGDLASIDLCFIDGNHRLQPTIQYFESILPKTGNFSVIVLDDIHWSAEMEQAWRHWSSHPSVTLSIDLFYIGLLFFRHEIKEKQHFTVRF
jgi:predicted O-methyltransferase YrrM